MMAGAILDTPELALDEAEAKALADAAARVAAHYDHTMDPRTLAWVNLAMVAGGIYGTRIFAIRARQKAAGPKAGPGRVVNFVQTPAAPGKGGAGPAAAAGPVQAQTPGELYGIAYSAATGD